MGYITEDEMREVYMQDAERKAGELMYEMMMENMPISARTRREVYYSYERNNSGMEGFIQRGFDYPV